MEFLVHRTDLEDENGDGKVYVACDPVEEGEEGFFLKSGDRLFTQNLATYLTTLSGLLTPEEIGRMAEEDWKEHCRRRRAYHRARGKLVDRLMAGFADKCLPQVMKTGVSRMGSPVHAEFIDRRTWMVMVRVSRGGDSPTFFGVKMLQKYVDRPVQQIQVSAQRGEKDPENGGRPKVAYKAKGRTPLDGKHLIIFEQASASGATVANVVPAVIDHCGGGTPLSTTFIYLNGCHHGIRETRKAVPGATIIVGCLHHGLDDSWYLINPGCGDVGAEEAEMPD